MTSVTLITKNNIIINLTNWTFGFALNKNSPVYNRQSLGGGYTLFQIIDLKNLGFLFLGQYFWPFLSFFLMIHESWIQEKCSLDVQWIMPSSTCRTVSFKWDWDGIGWYPGWVKYRAPWGKVQRKKEKKLTDVSFALTPTYVQ